MIRDGMFADAGKLNAEIPINYQSIEKGLRQTYGRG
jgi:hypothetical protein